MKRYGKRLVSVALVMVMLLTMLPTSASELNGSGIQNQIVSDELLGVMGVNYEELVSGDYEDSGDTYSCIIWIEDIDMEQAVRAGIDAAEMTRETYSMNREYEYPYEVMDVNGQKVVEVNLAADENNTYVQTYINAERATAAEMYAEKNVEFVADTFSARIGSVNYVSSYSPCVFADLTVDEIAKLLTKDEVQRIGYAPDITFECFSAEDHLTDAEWSSLDGMLNAIRVNEARNAYGVTGSGVRIGQIEPYCPNDASVTKNPNFSNTDYHASVVYSFMQSVARNAQYFATGLSNGYTTFYQNTEWLLGNGVNVINMSAGETSEDVYNTYTEAARWVDHIAYNHDVHFVVAAGNSGATGVTSPAMAYNAITVGATYSQAPYEWLNDGDRVSSYNNTYVGRYMQQTYKPDICAPGYLDSSHRGTSLSTPLVAGSVALMCELQPSLKTKQHIVKAILAATTNKGYRYVTGNTETFRKYGSGLLDCRAALWATYNNRYSTSTGTVSSSSTTKSYSMTVTSSDTSMRVALAYANRIKFDTTNHLSGTPYCFIGELRLDVYSPSGTLVASCTASAANLKIVEFDPRPYGTGSYTIKVTQTAAASNDRATNFGVAWR